MLNFTRDPYFVVVFLDDIVVVSGTVGTYIIMELNSPMLFRGVF